MHLEIPPLEATKRLVLRCAYRGPDAVPLTRRLARQLRLPREQGCTRVDGPTGHLMLGAELRSGGTPAYSWPMAASFPTASVIGIPSSPASLTRFRSDGTWPGCIFAQFGPASRRGNVCNDDGMVSALPTWTSTAVHSSVALDGPVRIAIRAVDGIARLPIHVGAVLRKSLTLCAWIPSRFPRGCLASGPAAWHRRFAQLLTRRATTLNGVLRIGHAVLLRSENEVLVVPRPGSRVGPRTFDRSCRE